MFCGACGLFAVRIRVNSSFNSCRHTFTIPFHFTFAFPFPFPFPFQSWFPDSILSTFPISPRNLHRIYSIGNKPDQWAAVGLLAWSVHVPVQYSVFRRSDYKTRRFNRLQSTSLPECPVHNKEKGTIVWNALYRELLGLRAPLALLCSFFLLLWSNSIIKLLSYSTIKHSTIKHWMKITQCQ